MSRNFDRLWLTLGALALLSIITMVVGRNAAQKPGLCSLNGGDYSEGAVVRTKPNEVVTCHNGKWVPSVDQ
jgi:hypothetical protein